MAHIGQEFAFGMRRGIGSDPRLHQVVFYFFPLSDVQDETQRVGSPADRYSSSPHQRRAPPEILLYIGQLLRIQTAAIVDSPPDRVEILGREPSHFHGIPADGALLR